MLSGGGCVSIEKPKTKTCTAPHELVEELSRCRAGRYRELLERIVNSPTLRKTWALPIRCPQAFVSHIQLAFIDELPEAVRVKHKRVLLDIAKQSERLRAAMMKDWFYADLPVLSVAYPERDPMKQRDQVALVDVLERLKHLALNPSEFQLDTGRRRSHQRKLTEQMSAYFRRYHGKPLDPHTEAIVAAAFSAQLTAGAIKQRRYRARASKKR